MRVKLVNIERAMAKGNEAQNWGQEVKGLNAYFEREDNKKYILHFVETCMCKPVLVFDGADMRLDGYTLIGFKKRTRLGSLQDKMLEQVREELRK